MSEFELGTTGVENELLSVRLEIITIYNADNVYLNKYKFVLVKKLLSSHTKCFGMIGIPW